MLTDRDLSRYRFSRLEIGFFLVYFLLFNILTDIEYNLYENHKVILFIKEIPARLLFNTIYMLPFAICYKTVIENGFFEKKVLRSVVLLILFLVFLNFYLLYSYWQVSKMLFLPVGIVSMAAAFYHADVPVHFSVVYVIRELLVLSALAYFIRSGKQEKLMNDLLQQQLRAELKYLKVQLQPHFFFNTLNNIYALTLKGSTEAAPLVAKHSEMMRYIIYESSSQKVGLLQEIAFLKNYAEVESVRYGERIMVDFETQGLNDGVRIEPLLLLPFVENAFKHGAAEETSEGYVRVIVCLVEEELILEVANSKPAAGGANPDEAGCMNPGKTGRTSSGKGIGLENVAKRLSLLYPQKHRLEIKEDEERYEVRLILQLGSDD